MDQIQKNSEFITYGLCSKYYFSPVKGPPTLDLKPWVGDIFPFYWLFTNIGKSLVCVFQPCVFAVYLFNKNQLK